jgi:hypothetical protein
MNRRGFVGLIATLAGAMGLRGQQTTSGQLPYSFKRASNPGECVTGFNAETGEYTTAPCPGALTPLKEGEEYCPGWGRHAQKPLHLDGTSSSMYMRATEEYSEARFISYVVPHICSVCGIVYVPVEKKP